MLVNLDKYRIRKAIEANVRVDTLTGCWIWGNGKEDLQERKYGRCPGWMQRSSLTLFTHRAAYFAWKGEIEGKRIIHSCGTFLCCNPDHLFIDSELPPIKI